MSERNIFTTLRGGGRIWAVGAAHGEPDRLNRLHAHLWGQLAQGDQLVYAGNLLGRGPDVAGAVDQVLMFRRAVMARLGSDGDDIVFLRGAQEEMWQKLTQLQFATSPGQVLQWMLDQGVGATIRAYGGNPDDGMIAAREGVLALTRWTSSLRQAMRDRDGHTQLMSVLKHAAFTADNVLLFVHAGVDPGRPLAAQNDSFWWAGSGFASLDAPYAGFARVVRGFDPKRGGFQVGPHAVTIDGGCGFEGGQLLAVCFDPDGNPIQMIEA